MAQPGQSTIRNNLDPVRRDAIRSIIALLWLSLGLEVALLADRTGGANGKDQGDAP